MENDLTGFPLYGVLICKLTFGGSPVDFLVLTFVLVCVPFYNWIIYATFTNSSDDLSKFTICRGYFGCINFHSQFESVYSLHWFLLVRSIREEHSFH